MFRCLVSLLLFFVALPSPAMIPIRSQAAGLNAAYLYIRVAAEEDNLQSFLKVYTSDDGSGPLERPRYLYSRKWGWIDLKHFFASARYSALPLVSAKWAIALGELNEMNQQNNGGLGAWDYEDLISNLLGAYYPDFKDEFPDLVSEKEIDTVREYLKILGVVEFPRLAAPNFGELPPREGRIEPHHRIKNRTYIPMFATEDPADGNEIDHAILELRNSL